MYNPLRKIKSMYENYKLRKIKSMYENYYPREGTAVLTVGGAVVGGIVGLALPLYVGWEIGDYVKNAFEFGPVLGTVTKAFGAILLTTGFGGVTVPAGVIVGVATEARIGVATGKVKESLESLVSKK